MKTEFTHEELGEVYYRESVWTGAKQITLNGRGLLKIGKNSYVTVAGDRVEIKESYFAGTILKKGEATLHLTQPIKWYDVVLSLLPFILMFLILILAAGNPFERFDFDAFLILGFLIAIFALVSVFNLLVIKNAEGGFKFLISILAFGVNFLIFFFFGQAVEGMILGGFFGWIFGEAFGGITAFIRFFIVFGVLGGCLAVVDIALVLLKEKKIWIRILMAAIVLLCVCGIICGIICGIHFANQFVYP